MDHVDSLGGADVRFLELSAKSAVLSLNDIRLCSQRGAAGLAKQRAKGAARMPGPMRDKVMAGKGANQR